MEQGLHIKPDPATASTPSAFDEDDYEDTGELEIPKDPNAKAWLTRLPDWLWEAWADIAEDEEIELGKVYVEKGTATPEVGIATVHLKPPSLTVPPDQDRPEGYTWPCQSTEEVYCQHEQGRVQQYCSVLGKGTAWLPGKCLGSGEKDAEGA